MKKKARKRWQGYIKWSELKATEGGRGHNLTAMLKADGLKASRDYSPYIGNVGVYVEINNRKEAETAARTITGSAKDASWLFTSKEEWI